jgi:hypothetical protein
MARSMARLIRAMTENGHRAMYKAAEAMLRNRMPWQSSRTGVYASEHHHCGASDGIATGQCGTQPFREQIDGRSLIVGLRIARNTPRVDDALLLSRSK